jgi:hypothetical protein
MRSLTDTSKRPAAVASATRATVPPKRHPAETLQGLLGNRALQALLDAGKNSASMGRVQSTERRIALGGPGPLQRAMLRPGHHLESSARLSLERGFERSLPVAARTDGPGVAVGKWTVSAPESNAESAAKAMAASAVAGGRFPRPVAPRPDFAAVRVHADRAADEAARSLDARAFTIGNDIYFAAGQYNPHGAAGRHLLAHELSHVLQSRTAASPPSVIMRETWAEQASKWYDEKKWQIYRGMIAGLKSAKNTGFNGLRSQIPKLPASMQAAVGTIIDVADFCTDLLIALMLIIIGLAVGFVEGIVGLIVGILKLAFGLLKLITDWFVAFLGKPEAFAKDINAIADAVKNIPPGLKKVIDDWVARYKKASLEEQAIMGGELIGQIEAFIATFALAGTKAGQATSITVSTSSIKVGKVAAAAAALEKAPAVVVAIPAVVPKTLAEAGVVSAQMMAMSGQGPGGPPPTGGSGTGQPKKDPLKNLSEQEIDKALDPLQESKAPQRPGGKGAPQAAAATRVTVHVEDAVAEATQLLKQRGVKGLSPSEYGSKLHAAVSEVIEARTGQPPTGWAVVSEQKLGSIAKLRPENAALTVRQYMAKWGMSDRFPKFPEKFMSTEIQNLKPDLMVRAPDGRTLVWDLTSQLTPEHLSKTMFYTEIIGREQGGFFRIAETYWKKVLSP